MFSPQMAPSKSFPYRIESQVGQGSMGLVFRAVEIALDRAVAIKVLRQSILDEEPPDVQNEIRRRFQQEAKAAAALSHPGVTTVYRVGEEKGLPYIVMEWLDGRTLDAVLQERHSLTIPEALNVTIALLDTLNTAHRNGVIHRDIKPSNLVLLKDGRLKVTDFGIALLQGREMVKTQAGVVLATPKFASPEQLRGIEVDGRADLFATGILLYRMVTGTFPFEGEGFMELANAILTQEPTPIRNLQPEAPAALETILRKVLRKDRKDRFSNARDMAEALRPLVSAENPLADSPTVGTNPTTIVTNVETARLAPVLHDLPSNPGRALVRIVESWPGRQLDRQSTLALLDRLLEKPLHAPAFSGAVVIHNACLLICDGILIGAVDRMSGEHGDKIVESLPADGLPMLHPVPERYPSGLVSLLGTTLHPPKLRHADLDSSFVNLPVLAGKLREEKFSGIFRLRRGQAQALLFFNNGDDVLSIFTRGWQNVPVGQSWKSWVSQFQVLGSVEEKEVRPLNLWYRRTCQDFEFEARPMEKNRSENNSESGSNSSSRLRQLFQSSRSNPLATGEIILRLSPRNEGGKVSHGGGYEQASAYRLANWALGALPRFFAERDKTSRWKYLSEWIPNVRRVILHHELPRPGSRETDYFDLVTADDEGKVLHLGHQVAHCSVEVFQEFLERVITAKTARIKTGDIGGVLLVAPSFDENVLESYAEAVQKAPGKFFGVEESFTGYAGFVRIGARRGFHLLLVEENGSGYTPLILG